MPERPSSATTHRRPAALVKSPPGDGRVQRGRRNRERIVEALRELVRSGVLQPSAQQVAERAGVGERSVYRHFVDMEKLYAQIGSLVQAEIGDIVESPPPSEGPLARRIAGLVAWRARLFERIAPFQRSGSLHRHRSHALQKQHAALTSTMRGQLEVVFGAEITGLDGVRVEALDAVASFETWERLRTEQRLGPTQAARVVESALAALLGADRGRAQRRR